MAMIVFSKTNDEIIRGLMLGGMIGGALAAILYVPGRPDLVYMSIGFFLPVVAFGLAGLATKSYKSACSECGADLTKFCPNPSDKGLIHCPACGQKFNGSVSA